MHTRWFEEFTVGEKFTTRGATPTESRIVDPGLIERSNIAGPGLDEVRWLAPVKPGDTLISVIEVLSIPRTRPEAALDEA